MASRRSSKPSVGRSRSASGRRMQSTMVRPLTRGCGRGRAATRRRLGQHAQGGHQEAARAHGGVADLERRAAPPGGARAPVSSCVERLQGAAHGRLGELRAGVEGARALARAAPADEVELAGQFQVGDEMPAAPFSSARYSGFLSALRPTGFLTSLPTHGLAAPREGAGAGLGVVIVVGVPSSDSGPGVSASPRLSVSASGSSTSSASVALVVVVVAVGLVR
jgi:hypothetical protein